MKSLYVISLSTARSLDLSSVRPYRESGYFSTSMSFHQYTLNETVLVHVACQDEVSLRTVSTVSLFTIIPSFSHKQVNWVGSAQERFQLAHFCVHDGKKGGLALVLWGACANAPHPVDGSRGNYNWEWCDSNN